MSQMRLLLVISRDGEDRDEIAQKYDINKKSEKHKLLDIGEAEILKKRAIETMESQLDNEWFPMTQKHREQCEETYRRIREMSVEDFFRSRTNGCEYDESGTTAYTKANADGHYTYPTCYQERLEKEGEEGPLSTPFTLLDGTLSYTARLNDIDWSKMHGANKKVYEAAWELCVEGREPRDRREQGIVDRMANRYEYFSKFKDKEEYARHSTSFFTYAVATSDKYFDANYKEDPKAWVSGFYDRFITPLKEENPTLTIYEIRFP